MKLLRQEKGISIIETVLAIVVASIIGLGISYIFGVGITNVIKVAHENEAINRASEGMELVKAIPYNNLPPDNTYTPSGTIPSVLNPGVRSLIIGKNTAASRSVQILTTSEGYKEITVTVSWSNGLMTRHRRMVSYMASR